MLCGSIDNNKAIDFLSYRLYGNGTIYFFIQVTSIDVDTSLFLVVGIDALYTADRFPI